MQTDDVVVRAQVLDGVWETIGSDRAPGIVPENLIASANGWGSDKAPFDLRRDPGAAWLDLQAFTPIDIEIAGKTVIAGRIAETPSREGDDPVVNVQVEGAQYNLDDDVYAKAYVHSRVGEWRDGRTFPDINLTNWTAAPTVSNDNGIVTIMFPKSQVCVVNTFAGILLDLGPNNTAASISIDYESSNNSAAFTLFARATATPLATTAGPSFDAFNFLNNAGASGSNRGTFSTPSRYVSIFAFQNSGADTTPGADVWFKIKAIRVFTTDAWRSTDASILKASDVVADARKRGAPMLSSDVSKIAATVFAIPDLHFERDPRTPREVIDGVNALHNYLTQVDTDRRLVFQPRPSAPLFEVGAWGGSTFEDASMNSGQDVYNRALVTGTGPDGSPIINHVTNAYTVTTQEVTTKPFSKSPAGTFWPNCTFTGDWIAGLTYRIHVSISAIAGGPTDGTATFTLGGETFGLLFPVAGSPVVLDFLVTPSITSLATAGTLSLTLAHPAGSGTASANVKQLGTTILDRLGFTRTKILQVPAALTTTVANQIGNTFLAGHRAQPLKGVITAGIGGIRRVLGGETVHPAHMLRETGQLIRLSHRIDPDTGGLGRDGTIASVTYDHSKREARIEIDSDRRDYEALLSRFAALSPA